MAISPNMGALVPFLAILSNCFAQEQLLGDDYLIDNENQAAKVPSVPEVREDASWPGLPFLKQVTGLSVDRNGNLHVFHRGDRVWDRSTFDKLNMLTNIKQGPIPNDTILVLDPENGQIVYSWGANRFYMPHGLNIDKFGNTFITDVGLHQVMKFPAGQLEPELVLGKAFTPGSDKHHFCKPSDTAVTPEGHIFVSDGYCNSRIVMFTAGGKFIKEVGSRDGMVVPHSLTMIPQHNALCAADRENGRILCYATGGGKSAAGTLLAAVEKQGLGRVFAIDARGKDLFVVNGPDIFARTPSISADQGLIIDIESGTTTSLWGPQHGFSEPHDMAVSPDGRFVYVSEIDVSAPKHVYKFHIRD